MITLIATQWIIYEAVMVAVWIGIPAAILTSVGFIMRRLIKRSEKKNDN